MRHLLFTTLLLGACAGPAQVIEERSVLQQVAARYRAFYPPPEIRTCGTTRASCGRASACPPWPGPGPRSPSMSSSEAGPRGCARRSLRPASLTRPPGAASPIGALAIARTPRPSGARKAETPRPSGARKAGLGTLARRCRAATRSCSCPSAASPSAAGLLLRLEARPAAAPPPAAMTSTSSRPGDAPTRAPRSVWLRRGDPDLLETVRVAHLSDLHVGKGPEHGELFVQRLRQVISDVNAGRPDLVIVTGDIVNRARTRSWRRLPAACSARSRRRCCRARKPRHRVLHEPLPAAAHYELGWPHFARAFHPYLHFSVRLGGYDFVGFDSGPTVASPRVLTGGLLPASLAEIQEDVDDAHRAGRRGVVLFSHAPSRARLSGRGSPRSAGLFGRMKRGRAAFEDIMLSAAARGQRVLHLTGAHPLVRSLRGAAGPARAARLRPLVAAAGPADAGRRLGGHRHGPVREPQRHRGKVERPRLRLRLAHPRRRRPAGGVPPLRPPARPPSSTINKSP